MRNIFMAGTPGESLGQSWMKTGWGWIVPEGGGARRGSGWAQSGWGIPIPAPAPEDIQTPPPAVAFSRVLFGRDRMGLPLGPTAPTVQPQQEPVMVERKTGQIIPGLMGNSPRLGQVTLRMGQDTLPQGAQNGESPDPERMPNGKDRPIRDDRPEGKDREPKQGFHGKAQITYEEAEELLELVDEILRPLSEEEAAAVLESEECARNISKAGNYPKVEKLRERLAAFLAAGDKTASFTISQGELTVTGHAVECAESIGRKRVIKTVAVTGGIGAAALLLLL